MKSPYSLSVTRNEFGVPATVVPTISLFSTWYFALPFNWCQPVKSLLLNKETHSSLSFAETDDINIKKARIV
jgi:hypothetical protein